MFVKDSSMHFHHSVTSTGLLILFSLVNFAVDGEIMGAGKQQTRHFEKSAGIILFRPRADDTGFSVKVLVVVLAMASTAFYVGCIIHLFS